MLHKAINLRSDYKFAVEFSRTGFFNLAITDNIASSTWLIAPSQQVSKPRKKMQEWVFDDISFWVFLSGLSDCRLKLPQSLPFLALIVFTRGLMRKIKVRRSYKDILFGIIGCLDVRMRYLWIIFYYWQNNIYTLVDRTNILPPSEFFIPKLILSS